MPLPPFRQRGPLPVTQALSSYKTAQATGPVAKSTANFQTNKQTIRSFGPLKRYKSVARVNPEDTFVASSRVRAQIHESRNVPISLTSISRKPNFIRRKIERM